MGICDSKSKAEQNATTPQPTNITATHHQTNNIATPQIINDSTAVNEGNYPKPTIQQSSDQYLRFKNNPQNQAGLNVQVPGDLDRPSNIDRHVSLGSSINMNDDDSMSYNQPRNTLASNNQ